MQTITNTNFSEAMQLSRNQSSVLLRDVPYYMGREKRYSFPASLIAIDRFKYWARVPDLLHLVQDDGGLCCTNPMRDSSCESSVVAGGHEQTHTPRLQDQELARLSSH